MDGHGGKRRGAGRKPKASELDLQSLMDSCWTDRQRKETIKAWAKRAEMGDLEAGKMLMAYAYGKPTEHRQIEILNPKQAAIDAVKRFREDFPNVPVDELVEWAAQDFGVDKAELITEAVN